jgi:hypothetical protein
LLLFEFKDFIESDGGGKIREKAEQIDRAGISK